VVTLQLKDACSRESSRHMGQPQQRLEAVMQRCAE
jgi:hypothetical protein